MVAGLTQMHLAAAASAGVLAKPQCVVARWRRYIVLPCLVPQVWDVQTLKCLRTLEGHEDNVRVLAVGNRHMYSGSWDKTIRRAARPSCMAASL